MNGVHEHIVGLGALVPVQGDGIRNGDLKKKDPRFAAIQGSWGWDVAKKNFQRVKRELPSKERENISHLGKRNIIFKYTLGGICDRSQRGKSKKTSFQNFEDPISIRPWTTPFKPQPSPATFRKLLPCHFFMREVLQGTKKNGVVESRTEGMQHGLHKHFLLRE